jgi:hypothetical protein
MGLFSGLFSNKKGIRDAKEVAGAQQHTAIAAMEAADRERARAIANEQAKMAVWGLLGSDGSFGTQNTFTQGWQNQSNVDDPTSLFDTSGTGLSQPNQALRGMGPNDPNKNNLLGVAREGILDPASYANAISNTAQFRIQSQRVAESEQLLNQEGPAWDMLNNSVLGIINEGSAMQLRDTMRKLKNQYAKGGTARRTAMFEANELAAGERAMRTRVQETWQANLALYDSVRQNADRVAAGTASFMAGLPLVNDSYRDAMQRTAQLQISASEIANNTIMSAYDTKMTQQPVDFLTNMMEGAIKLVPSIVGGAVDSYLGSNGSTMGSLAKGGMAGAVGGTYRDGAYSAGTSGGVQGALSGMFSGRPNAGYTPRGYAPGQSTYGGMDSAQNYLQSAFDYMNSGPESNYNWEVGGDDTGENVADRYMSG